MRRPKAMGFAFPKDCFAGFDGARRKACLLFFRAAVTTGSDVKEPRREVAVNEHEISNPYRKSTLFPINMFDL